MIEISRPTLLVDEPTVRSNIQRMADKALQHRLTLTPHFKTHQSRHIGQWFREAGIDTITVSSLKMARYFADAGWNDITIAFPCIPLHANVLNELAKKTSITTLLSNAASFNELDQQLKQAISVFIEIDTGAHRTGFAAKATDDIRALIKQISESAHVHFKGFYSHPGHSYHCRSREEIQHVHQRTVTLMQSLKEQFSPSYPDLEICIGDTPCCSVGKNFEGIDRISPGNFVFYDLMQVQIESCNIQHIGVALACPVIARYPQRGEIAVHGGAIHLAKEALVEEPIRHFGWVVPLNDDLTWGKPIENSHVKSLSQEHGIIQCSRPFFEQTKPGDLVGILPVHSCLTANAMKGYLSTKSGRPIDHMQGSPLH